MVERLAQKTPDRDRSAESATVLALTGGIGGAKLALGLHRVLQPGELTVVCNTGDDFRHLGLHISPDVDTILYTLSDLADQERGWGRRWETWHFMEALEEVGGETWFQLGDRDLAVHVERTRRLNNGELFSAVIDSFRRRLGLATHVLPMSDESVRTQLLTRNGEWLEFQEYFVRRRCEPAIEQIRFVGAATAKPVPGLLTALQNSTLKAVVVCPSNPLISIDPILAVPGIREALCGCAAPVVAVSPLIGGRAVKGPTAKLMHELGLEPCSGAVAERYADFVDAWIVDEVDAAEPVPRGVRRVVTKTLMLTLEDREQLARDALEAAHTVPVSNQKGDVHLTGCVESDRRS